MALSPEARRPQGAVDWIRAHLAGLACSTLGVLSVAIAALLCYGGEEVTRIPDVRVTTPFLVAALVAAIASFVRREGVLALPIAGIALAASAMVLGWAIVVGVIAIVTVTVILIMQELM